MADRIPPSQRTSQAIAELLGRGSESEDVKSELLRLAVRKIVEEALEAEVNDALGRGYYERGAQRESGYRNGYRSGRLRSAEGAIEYSAPQVSDRAEFLKQLKKDIEAADAAVKAGRLLGPFDNADDAARAFEQFKKKRRAHARRSR